MVTEAPQFLDERDHLMSVASGLSGVISLGLGDPDHATPTHIVAAAQAALREGLCDHRTDPAGLPELRRALAAKLLRDNSLVADPETEITVTTGGQEALFILIQCLLNPGDEILVQDPRYSSYDLAIARAGATMIELPTDEADDFELDPEVVAARITPRTKAILLITPGNPTGAVDLRPSACGPSPTSPSSTISPSSATKFTRSSSTRAAAPQRRLAAGDARAHDHPQRLLQDLRHDRLATRLRRRAPADHRRDPRPERGHQRLRPGHVAVGRARRDDGAAGLRRLLPQHLRRAPPRPDGRPRRLRLHLRPPLRCLLHLRQHLLDRRCPRSIWRCAC